MEILIRVAKKSLIIILLAAAVSAFFEWKKLPLGIIAGGLFGVLTLRGVVRSVERFINSERATAKIIFFNMSRLVVLFMALFILIWTKAINVFGMLFWFYSSLCSDSHGRHESSKKGLKFKNQKFRKKTV